MPEGKESMAACWISLLCRMTCSESWTLFEKRWREAQHVGLGLNSQAESKHLLCFKDLLLQVSCQQFLRKDELPSLASFCFFELEHPAQRIVPLWCHVGCWYNFTGYWRHPARPKFICFGPLQSVEGPTRHQYVSRKPKAIVQARSC